MNNLTSGSQQVGYYGTKWGNVTRISQKVGSAWEACRDCFGMVAGNMYTKFLGARQTDIRKSIQSKLNNPDGWELIPMDQLDKLGKSRRCQRCGGLLDETTGGCTSQTCPFNDHYQKCKAGWIGHPDHPDVDDNTPCICAQEDKPEKKQVDIICIVRHIEDPADAIYGIFRFHSQDELEQFKDKYRAEYAARWSSDPADYKDGAEKAMECCLFITTKYPSGEPLEL